MTEKINGQGFRPVETGGVRRSEQTGQARGAGAARGNDGDGDTVNVEASQLLISRLDEALAIVPAVDAERVRAVRDAIASGNYQIDAGVIAEKMIRLERELNF
jgi:negative regulator of flagellin synthesis FlgM